MEQAKEEKDGVFLVLRRAPTGERHIILLENINEGSFASHGTFKKKYHVVQPLNLSIKGTALGIFICV